MTFVNSLLKKGIIVFAVLSVLAAGCNDAKFSTSKKDDKQSIEGKSVSEVETLAKEGNVYAQTKLGNLYRKGEGVSKDLVKAVAWYQKAADQGNADSQYNLGLHYAYFNDATDDDFLKITILSDAEFKFKVSFYRAQGISKFLPVCFTFIIGIEYIDHGTNLSLQL